MPVAKERFERVVAGSERAMARVTGSRLLRGWAAEANLHNRPKPRRRFSSPR